MPTGFGPAPGGPAQAPTRSVDRVEVFLDPEPEGIGPEGTPRCRLRCPAQLVGNVFERAREGKGERQRLTKLAHHLVVTLLALGDRHDQARDEKEVAHTHPAPGYEVPKDLLVLGDEIGVAAQ